METKTKWLYNGIIYNTRRELTDKFKWSTCKFIAKLTEDKITKLTEAEAYEYLKIHNNIG